MKAAARGGQVLVTKTTRDLAGGRLGGGFGLLPGEPGGESDPGPIARPHPDVRFLDR